MNSIVSLKVPSSNGVSLGLEWNTIILYMWIYNSFSTYPNITAFHNIMLLSVGAPFTPAGGSSCNLWMESSDVYTVQPFPRLIASLPLEISH